MALYDLPPERREEALRLIRAAERGDTAAADHLNQPYTWKTQSPLERDLVIAISERALERWVPEVYEDQRDYFIGTGDAVFRLETQVKIGPYTADILLSRPNDDLGIVVECDGHDFHEKTKAQAAHDKKRDRFLQGCGYRVLRFTGSEIHRDADAMADEVLSIAADLARRGR